ncbi:hypothetical protein CONLIGDRAFT_638592 [Coniochaeta ligniaria NRRL 30616]|uniref:Uncharacterized protein n=1 Tax=Coniochaeta ligniaria NRRL 30616 TaxID=1408157 RepID=A0A1J7IYY3_9PEZI|nr:hypothetical protein CONLIGDRAFT_638592 [Coniochaeta ligniaria NRRL 30616]
MRELLLDHQAASGAGSLACRLVQALGCMCISTNTYTAPCATFLTAARRSHWRPGRIETGGTSDSASQRLMRKFEGWFCRWPALVIASRR